MGRGSRLVRLSAVLLSLAAAACATAGEPHQTSSAAARQPLPYALDPYPSTYRPGARTDTLIVGATVLDGTGRRLDRADVLLRDGKVAAIGKGLAAPAGARVIDAQGRWVTPGIIDVHSHDGDFAMPLTANDLKTLDVSEISDPNSAQVWAEHSVNPQDPSFARALEGGVTTVQVLPGSDPLFGGRSVVLKTVPAVTVQAMKFPGAPYGMKMACGENPKGEFGAKGRFPNSRMGEMAGYRSAWLAARAYKARWERYEKEGGRPPDRDLKLDTLAAALAGDIRVHMHCYKADEMAQIVDLSHEMGYHVSAFHHAVEAYKIPDLLRREGVCAVVWADWWGFKMEALDAIRENAAYLDAQGVCVTLHSDSPNVGQHLPVEAGKAMAAAAQAGLDIPPERAIRWITSNAAQVLGLQAQIGSLEPGKNADVVIWSGNPFSVYTKADQVFLDGALVFDRTARPRLPLSDFELGQPALEPRS